ncbi:hypothetical protein ACFT2C_03405 [Promicromonospora sp. NPDC057138]|uniref:hypothetical protein n=1 Tax=Promicromonospora sp. NPDC057138 TaxID=3346031 RepID=UPI00363A1246
MTTAADRIHPNPAIGVQQALTLPQAELFALWRTLPAPDLTELDGEYLGYTPILNATDEEIHGLAELLYREGSPRGVWLGKAYQAGAGAAGEGYNLFRVSADGAGVHGYVRRARFATSIDESLIDGRSSLMMRYAAFDNSSARTDLVDEVRRYSHGLYLGTATTLLPDGTRTQPDGCFLLAGPFGPWTGVDDPALEQR